MNLQDITNYPHPQEADLCLIHREGANYTVNKCTGGGWKLQYDSIPYGDLTSVLQHYRQSTQAPSGPNTIFFRLLRPDEKTFRHWMLGPYADAHKQAEGFARAAYNDVIERLRATPGAFYELVRDAAMLTYELNDESTIQIYRDYRDILFSYIDTILP
jgi:hypothetical protein